MLGESGEGLPDQIFLQQRRHVQTVQVIANAPHQLEQKVPNSKRKTLKLSSKFKNWTVSERMSRVRASVPAGPESNRVFLKEDLFNDGAYLARQIMISVMHGGHVEDGEASVQAGGALEEREERLFGDATLHAQVIGHVNEGEESRGRHFAGGRLQLRDRKSSY